MSDPPNLVNYGRTHREVWTLLPWYANHSLDSHERAKIDRHLKSCSRCQVELTLLEKVQRTVRDTDITTEAMEHSLAALKSRMTGLRSGKPSGLKVHRGLRRWFRSVWSVFVRGNSSVRTLVAFQSVLVVTLSILLSVSIHDREPEGSYRTLSAQEQLPRGDGTILRIVFAEDTTESQLRAILHRLPAEIIRGPTENGIYTVALKLVDAESVTLEQRLNRLKAESHVRLVTQVKD